MFVIIIMLAERKPKISKSLNSFVCVGFSADSHLSHFVTLDTVLPWCQW